MAQRRFWNFKDDDATKDLNRWLTGLLPSGRYFGFDLNPSQPANLLLELVHTVTGFAYVGDDEVEIADVGMIITRQGTLVQEDAALAALAISAGDVSNPRIDVIILTHEYAEQAGGQTASYSVIEGTPAASPTAPPLTDTARQVKIGELFVPANMTDLTDGALVWTPEITPGFAGISSLDRNLTANRALVSDSGGDLVVSVITATELGYLDDVTSNIQDQLDAIGGGLKKSVFEIGDWDMETSDFVEVTIVSMGILFANFRGITVIIRNDADSSRVDLVQGPYTNALGIGSIEGNITLTPVNVLMARFPAGRFDVATFNDTSYNRGWIIVEHV